GDALHVRWPVGQEPVELARADDPEGDVRCQARRGEDRVQPVQRDQLADEEDRAAALPPGPENALLRADEADLDAPRAERSKHLGVRRRVGHDQIGGPERAPVDRAKRARGQAAGAEPAAVADQGVAHGDERVEDEGASLGRASRRADVEVPGIADDHGVEGFVEPPPEPELCGREPRGGAEARAPLLLASLPDRHVALDHLDPGAPQARDRLRVPRIAPLVRAEVEDLQLRISSTSASARSRSDARSSWWLVISSVIRPSENTCSPTTTSRTPRISSGRWPIACPRTFSIVR